MWILREIVARGGEIDFRQFMELALYDSEHGYYGSGKTPWGRDGDFLTAPTASQWYALTWAGFLADLSVRLKDRVELVDLAAGDGSFLAGVLDGLGDRSAAVLAEATAVERSRVMRDRIDDRIPDPSVRVRSIGEIDGGISRRAVVHASELYDAMPVHRVVQTTDGMMEMIVAAADGRLTWRRRPVSDAIEAYFRTHDVELVEGQTAEVNLEAEASHHRLLDAIGEGLVMVLDYGYPAARLYDPRGRRRGSLATYHRHELGDDPLVSPGERDLTAHVNFDDLRRAASGRGWHEIALMPMAEFLVRAGIGERVDQAGFGINAELDADTVGARQEIKRLLDPEGMGSDLKMLIQGKGRLGEIAGEMLTRVV